jgi:outer membrane protein OmpA-like peptidoglycan-associated protein
MAIDDIPNTQIDADDNEIGFSATLFNFGVGKSQLLPDHRRFLERHAEKFLEAADDVPPINGKGQDGGIAVVGFASNTGNPAFNVTLSKNRAREVCVFLQHGLGVPAGKFSRDFRDEKTGEAVGQGFGATGERGKEDGFLRGVKIIALRPRPQSSE